MSLRVLGGGILLLCVLLFQPGAETDLQRLWLPLLMGLGAMLTLQNVLAITATGAVLALLRMDLAGDWISAMAYPAVAAICIVACCIIGAGRFATYTHQTRAARQDQRANRRRDDP